MKRIILHVDMDAFFSSVEVVDNPRLKGKPVIVGGKSERGVVSTCSYEARKFGVTSAMPIYKAKMLCPNGIFLPVRYGRYVEISNKIFEILYTITDLVEKVSIDEAYLDVTDIKEDPELIALKIKSKILMELGLTISVGISYNKFLAKLASDWEKPNGLKIITDEMVPMVLFPLSIEKVHGLGNQSVKKLNNIGIFTIEDLYGLPKKYFEEYFGKHGVEIYSRIRGIDNRRVVTERERKSVGKEITLKKDTKDIAKLREYLRDFSKFIAKYLRENNIVGKTLTLKMKTASFESHTKSKTFHKYLSTEEDIYKEGCKILNEVVIEEEIRLIGLTISSLESNIVKQLTFY